MKYRLRRPRMAKMFEVKTMSGSLVRAKMAGTESTANTMSVISRKSRAMKSGVACMPAVDASRRSFCPCSSVVTGTQLAEELDDRVLLRLHPLLLGEHHAHAGEDQEDAEEQITHWYCMRAAPMAMKMARKTSAPRMPKNSTRCWYSRRDHEVVEHHHEHEDVVDGERVLDHVAGQELRGRPRQAVGRGVEARDGQSAAGRSANRCSMNR